MSQRLPDAAVRVRPQDRAAFVFPRMFGQWASPAMAADLLGLAQEWRPDLVVHEQAADHSPAASGAGIALDPDRSGARSVTDAVRRVLVEDGFTQAALELADQVRAMPGPDEVVTVLERLA